MANIRHRTRERVLTAAHVKSRTRESRCATMLRALWRWIVSYDSRERLSFTVDEIVRDNRMNSDLFSSALDDFADYMTTLYTGQTQEATDLYSHIRTTYPIAMRNLAKCAILLRHGLFKSQLAARDYDLIQELCGRINGGAKLRPFLSKIHRANRIAP